MRRLKLKSCVRYLCVAASLLVLTTCDMFKSGLGPQIDIAAPSVDVSTANGAYLRGTVTLKGSASDDVSVASVAVNVSIDSVQVASITAAISNGSWSADLDTKALSGGKEVQADLDIKITDNSGRTSDKKLIVYFDNVAPVLTGMTPSSANLASSDYALSERTTISGSVKDGLGLAKTILKVGDISLADTTHPAAWSLVLDATQFYDAATKAAKNGAVADSGLYRVAYTVVATDFAGNTSDPATGTLYINPDGAPAVNVSDLTAGINPSVTYPRASSAVAPTTASPSIAVPGSKFKFRVSDLDGIDRSKLYVVLARGSDLTSGSTVAPSALSSSSTVYRYKLSGYKDAEFSSTLSESVLDSTTLSGGGTVPTRAEYSITLPQAVGEYLLFIHAADLASNKISGVSAERYLPEAPSGAVYKYSSLYITNSTTNVTIDSPSEGGYSPGTLSAGGSASSDDGLDSVTLTVTNTDTAASMAPDTLTIAGEPTAYAWSYSKAGLSDGHYSIAAFATNHLTKSSSTVTRNFTVDTTRPSATISALPGYQSGRVGISGASGDTGSGVAKVEYQLDSGDWTSAGGTSPWSGSLDLSAAAESDHTLRARATDFAKNVTDPADYASLTIPVDRANPRATMSASAANYLASGSLFLTNATLLLSGTADDAAITSGRAASSAVLSYTKDGVAQPSASLSPAADGSWSWTLTPNAATHADDGLYAFTLTVTDVAGKTATASRTVQIDTTAPTITVNAPAAGDFSTSASYGISGTSRDTGGVGFDGNLDAEYSLDGASWTPLNSLASMINWSAANVSLGAEGAKTLYVRSTDALGNQASTSVAFYYDLAKPVITESTINTTDTVYRSADFSFGGTWTESNRLASIAISYQKDGGASSASAATLSPNANGTGVAWSATIDVDTDNTGLGDTTGIQDGLYVFTILATDIAGRTASLTRTVVIDTTAPVVSPPATPSSYVATTVSLAGSASDPGAGASGVELAQYSLDGSSWSDLDGTASWSKVVDLSSAAEGSASVQFRARDKAGIYSAVASTAVNVDHAPPRATMAAGGTLLGINGVQSTRLGFTLSGTADDAAITAGRAASSATLSYSRDGGAATNVTLSPAADGSWSWASSSASLTDGTRDGLYAFTLTVTDVAGKTSSSQQVIKVDTTAPTLVIAAPAPGESSLTNACDISGTSRDTGGVGFAGSTAAGSADAEYSLDNASWTALNSLASTINWSASGVSLGSAEGTKTLYLRSRDALGNMATASVVFYYDVANPSLTETSVGTTDTQYRNADLSFGGAASDSNALASLRVTLNGGSAVAIPVQGDNSWTYSFAAGSLAEGSYALVFTATDAANKTTSVARTVVVDRTQPSLTLSTINGGASATFADWKGTPVLSLVGTSSDGSGGGVRSVECSTDGTTWNALSGTANWSGAVPVTASTTTLLLRSTDNAGNARTISQPVRIDLSSPSISVTAPSSLARVGGAALATVSVGSDTGSGISSVLVKANSTDFSGGTASATMTSGNAQSGTWSATIPAADFSSLSDGTQYSVYVQATDGAGNKSLTSFSVMVDRTPPTAAFSSPAAASTVNRIIAVSGTGGDSQALSSVAVSIERSDLSTWDALQSFSGTAGYNWSIASFDTATYGVAAYDTSGAAGIQLTLRAVATDEAGNSYTATRSFTVDQDSDRPIVKLSNVNVDGSTTLKMANAVFGSVSDDDGVSSFEVSENGTSWTSVAFDGGWSYAASAGDGTKTLYFRVTDAAGSTFTSAQANAPRIQYGANTVSTAVSFKVDTLAPELSSVNPVVIDRTSAYDFADAAAIAANMPLGGGASGAYHLFRLRVLAKDANGIGGVSVAVPGAAGSPFVASASGADASEPTFTRFDTAPIDVSALADGVITMTVTVTDNSGLSSSVNRTVLIDNTAPSVTHSSPRALLDVVNGETTIKGLASDAGSGLASIKYQLGLCADRSASSSAWADVSGSLFSWEIGFTGSNKIDLYGGIPVALDVASDTFTLSNHGYANGTAVSFDGSALATGMSSAATYYVINATANTFQVSASSGGAAVDFSGSPSSLNVSKYSKDANNDGIWELPVLIRAADSAGNLVIEDYSTYVVLVDPSGDRPKVSIVYPDPGSANRTMGGTIRIFGTATDDDAVGSVRMQIDVDGDGSYTSADVDSTGKDWYNGGLGQPVSGTASWNQAINASGEFNPLGGGTRTIHFRVRAQDIYGTYGAWSSDQSIVVDNKLPRIGSSSALTLAQGGTVRAYVTDMWVKGNWTLTGSIEDESGIADIQVTGSVNGSLAGNPGWFSAATFGSNSGYSIAIPISTSGTGALSFTITATDRSTPATSNSVTVSVNYDNTAPTDNGYTGSTPVTQSNRVYTLKGSVNETGSGFDKLAFYFERTPTTARVYNPMESRTGDANRTNISALTMVDGLPCLAISGATRPDAYTLTSSALVNNKNARIGGLVSIGGIFRYILSANYATGTITWADAVDTSITTAYAAYALVVNNTTVETPVWSGSTLQSITNDDGDGMVEAVERSGGLYNWTASIDSTNIPDGPVEIHYVAYDKAGNYATGSVSTSVSNNLPLLAKVTLGTDLDGNGSVSAAEQVTAFSALDGSGNRQSTATVASSSFIAKDLTSVDIDVIGGNGILGYTVAYGGSLQAGYNDPVAANILRASESGGVNTISLSASALTAIGDTIVGGTAGAAKEIVFTIWDSTEETTRGSSSQSATLRVPMQVDITDDVSPTAAISPFYWNSASDNSVYGNSRANGHIEITGVEDGTDPDVSGQISIRGTAHDNTRLASLWMSIVEEVVSPPAINERFSFTGAGTPKTVGSKNYFPVATYSTATGSWTGTDRWATNGWRFTVTPVSLDQSGHTVNWQLDWDSSRVSGIAALNNLVRILATDKATRDSAESSSQTASGTPTPYYSMDVVPYITGVSRNSTLYNTNRSKYGRYPVAQGEAAITVNGFNLPASFTESGSANYVKLSNAASGGTLSASYPTPTASTSNVFTMTLNAAQLSGWLQVATNSVISINNLDDNAQAWNKEDDGNGLSSTKWSDDRFLSVWNVNQWANSNAFSSSANSQYPTMAVNSGGTLYGAWINYAAATVNYNTINGTTGTAGTARSVFAYYDPPEFVDIAMDQANDRQTIGYVQNTFGGNTPWNSGDSGSVNVWTSGIGTSAIPDSYDTRNAQWYAFITDGLWHNRMLWEHYSPRVVRSGANIHVAWYDDSSKSVKFATFAADLNSGVEQAWINIDGGSDAYDSNPGTGLVANYSGCSRTSSVGSSISIDVDKSGYPVIAYYDNANHVLRIAHANSASPSTLANWTVQTVNGGAYDSYAGANSSDKNGNITLKINHSTGAAYLVAYRPSKGQLVYGSAADRAASGTSNTNYSFGALAILDQAGNVGSWSDMSLNATSYPYVAYQNKSMLGTYDGVKIAYWDAAKSDWETMIAPASSFISDGKLSVVSNISQTDYSTAYSSVPWTMAVGFKSSSFQVMYLQPTN